MDEVTAAWYRRQSTISARAATAVQRLWREVDPARISESWSELLPQAVAAVTAGQLAASTQADTYTAAQLEQAGRTSDPAGKVNPTAFVGDSALMASLLYLPAIRAKVRIAGGMRTADALLSGQAQLVTAAQTETADAGRLATQVAVTNNRTARGYRRALRMPSCSRCIVLAGKWFEWNAGFLRHPNCDCIHIPAAEAGDLSDAMVNPFQAFDSMTAKEQDRAFGKAEAQAIRDGADIGQVVNARRGMGFADQMTTAEGTTRRGAYSRRVRATGGADETVIKSNGRNVTRVTGKSSRKSVRYIYWVANGDRDEAIRLLRKYAYIL